MEEINTMDSHPLKDKDKKHKFIIFLGLFTIFNIIGEIIGYFSSNVLYYIDLVSSLVYFFPATIGFFIISSIVKKKDRPELNLWSKIKLIVGMLIVEYIAVFIIMILTANSIDAVDNPIIYTVEDTSLISLTIVLAWSMFAEEAYKISTFFLFNGSFSYEDKNRYWISWIITSTIFGLFHLATYDYNVLQCLIMIGLPTIFYGYLWKKSMRPSLMWAVHFLFDYLIIMPLYLV
ncbi:type II CAAX prenyl endopeptidase Rce1 family protein [Anaerosphaera multitolerans]|uniref:CAAX prenyl protease 2/Lysostaphin resistance protein A-like domain-containing protein n=1 Tax=Anaerosphaera multitolerans TaxID=2487351 RepID=A0A437S4D2_9FIRM|nr:CPBP family glutamic-type intramembrane protease [Anaerosphaera multitolerans]RVU53869.1 hypothetical protein EF514_10355 [Anaerosphaera multitolerans]